MDNIIIENFFTPDNLPNAKIKYNNKTVTLHSIYPYKEAEKIISKFNPDLKWVLIVGLGYGYIPEYIIKNTNYNIIVYEINKIIFDNLIKYRNIDYLLNNNRFNIVFGEIENLFNFLENYNIKELNYYMHRPYQILFSEELSSVDGMIIAYLSKKNINKATLKRFQKVWLRNIIKNSYYYFRFPGINNIIHSFESYPAVVVGAGPSLEKNINILKEIQNKILIISTDTALKMLLDYEIIPDFIVSVDPQEKNALYLLFSKNKNIWLVIDSAASFLALSKYNNKKTILYDSIFPAYQELSKFWGEKGKLLCGGSVSTAAFDLCRFFKCNPIILIGQDLAYSKKYIHFKRTILEDNLYSLINRFKTYEAFHSNTLLLSDKIEIKGFNNDKVSSDRKFLTFLDWFKKEFKYTNATVINATEGGAFIEGAKHMKLSEVVHLYLKNSFDKNNLKFQIDFTPIDEKNYINFISEILNKINYIIDYAKNSYYSSIEIINAFEKNKNISKYINTLNEFDQILLNITKDYPIISRFLELTSQSSIELISEYSEETNLNKDLLEKWKILYKEIYLGLIFIKNLLSKRINISNIEK